MKKVAKQPSLRVLAKKYGTSHRAIDDLKKAGVDINDPEQVILKLSTQNPNWVPPDEFVSKAKNPSKSKKPTGNTDLGLRAAIDRLRQAELEAHLKFQSATTLAEEQRYLKVWTSVLEQLRKVEESQPDIEEANSASISKEELAAVLSGLFKNLRQDLETLPARIALVGQSSSEDVLKRVVEEEVGKVLDSLSSCRLLDAKN